MAYTGNYTAEDLDEITIDGIGTFGVAAIGFITLFVVVGVVIWLMGGFKKLGLRFK